MSLSIVWINSFAFSVFIFAETSTPERVRLPNTVTRRVPVQRAVQRDEIPYPYKVHDTTLRPHNYKIDHSRA